MNLCNFWLVLLLLAGCSQSPSGGSEGGEGPSRDEGDARSAGRGSGDHGWAEGDGSSEPTEPIDSNPLGAYPYDDSPLTLGGTMTFSNVGASGWWPRRLDREPGDPDCDYKDGNDTWGGHCCMVEHMSQGTSLAPFDAEMTLILKALKVKQLAVYQPLNAGKDWLRISSFDARTLESDNLWFTQQGAGGPTFPGNLTGDDCVGYLSQAPIVTCDALDYFCPEDPGVLHRGFSGSKLIVLLASMTFDDDQLQSCGGGGQGHPGPWVAFVASELIRDGARKWDGACNCYSKTGSVGDGCGEINVFEVVMDGNQFSNREFISTGVRSFQAGHVGGAVCQSDCRRDDFPSDAEVVDACAETAYSVGPEIVVGGASEGCPVWRRPEGDRYFFILLDEVERAIQVGIVHPGRIPAAAAPLLPALPAELDRATIDELVQLRLPG